MHNNVVFFPVIWDCFPQVTDYGYRLVPLMFILASLLDNMRCFVVGIGEWEVEQFCCVAEGEVVSTG